ncbi:MAG: N-acetylglucosamine-6-phosphate deacetylase [Dehalococcoidia bacterium]
MTAGLSLRAARVLTPGGLLPDAVVEIQDGLVVGVGAGDPATAVDLGEVTLCPGFVDLHVHGNGGSWWGQSEENDRGIARRMARSGTTSCLASLGGRQTLDEVLDSLRTTSRLVGSETGAVEILGIHMEGPFINPEKRGAWMPEQLRAPSVSELHQMQEAAAGTIKTMTIAPELPGALEVVSECIGLGIRPAIGHTNATYEEAMRGIEAGMTYSTHTYNGMRGLHHRDPGALGAVLAAPRLDAEVIADGQHVAEGAIRVLISARGVDQVIMVTDNVALSGLEPGEYGEGHWRVKVTEGGITMADGTIAGSVLPFSRHFANMVGIAGIEDASQMASLNPAGAIGLEDRKGSITAGKDADLVALDSEFNVVMTMTRGVVTYCLPELRKGVGGAR